MDEGRQRFLELLGKSRLKGSERAKLEGGEGEGGREGRPKDGGEDGEGTWQRRNTSGMLTIQYHFV